MQKRGLSLILMALTLGVGLWYFWGASSRMDATAPVALETQATGPIQVADLPSPLPESPVADPILSPLSPAEEAAAKIERNKAIDRENLAKLRTGIFAYLAKYGHYPEFLTQLVPEFVELSTLYSPQKKPDAVDNADIDHKDPGLAKPSYGYEFSNLVFRDGRTFAEIKEVQRREWGDVVPLLRCFAYDEVMNMAYGGDVYETALNWEWDAATMDLVEKYGWGPGLTTGEFVKVQVRYPNGQPASNVQVWADGRTFSFSLPNRPFPTDEHGWVTIPVGVDLDRTALSLRAEIPGMASPTMRYPLGQVPDSAVLGLEPVVVVGGTAVDQTGKPLPNSRVYLKIDDGVHRKASVTIARTNQDGRWRTSVHNEDLKGLTAIIGVPTGQPITQAIGQPIDPIAARANRAEVRLDQ